MGFSQLPLLWRVFAINATLLVIATLVLALTPVTIHAPIAFVEAVLVAVGLLLMLAANLLLLRHTLLPIRRLIEGMRTVDLLRPGQRLVVGGGVEAAELVRAFNQMLERLEVERRKSGRRALRAQEAERLRIARGLHDEVWQALTGVLLELDFLAGADPDAGDRRRAVDDAKRAVRQALEEVRRIAQELRPEMLEQLGLKSALTELSRRFADQSGVTVRRRFAEGLPALSDEAELAVYRVAQESLTNVALTPRRRRWSSRSSRAWAASSCGSPTTGGAWARRRPATGHGGLRGMRERALLVGGALAIRDGHGGGVEVRLEVPAGEATAGASSPAERRSASRRSSDIRS